MPAHLLASAPGDGPVRATGGGAGQQNKAFLAGARGVTTDNNDAVGVVIDSAGQLGTVSSSRRFKTDIRRLGASADRLMALQPVSFHYKQYAHTGNDRTEYGLIAEDVARVYPELVVDGPDGKPQTVMYQELPAILLALVQRQQRQIRAQQRELAAQRSEIAILGAQQRQITQLTRQVAALRRRAQR